MDIIIIQQLIKILDNDVQGILLFSEFFPFVPGGGLFSF